MALDLSGFIVITAQNQACSDSKQDSRAETCVTMLFGDRATQSCVSSAYCCCWMPRA